MEFHLSPTPSPEPTCQETPSVESVPSDVWLRVGISPAKATPMSTPVPAEVSSSSVTHVVHSSVSGDISSSPTNTTTLSNHSETATISSPEYSDITHEPFSDISSFYANTDTISSPDYSAITSPPITTETNWISRIEDPEDPSITLTGTTGILAAGNFVKYSRQQTIDDVHVNAKYELAEHSDILGYLNVSLISKIGSGANGSVYEVKNNSTSESFAAKIFMYNSAKKEENEIRFQVFREETGILQALKHRNIMNLIQAITGPTYGVLFLDYYQKGSLRDHLHTISDEMASTYFVNILDALRHMHSRRIIHRDVKPRNILVADNRVVLTDFGGSKKLPPKNNYVSGYVGTTPFMAPEVMATKQHAFPTHYDGIKADSYSLGVTLCCILLRRKPELDSNWFSYLRKHFHCNNDCDALLVDCARLLLFDDPNERASVVELIGCLLTV